MTFRAIYLTLLSFFGWVGNIHIVVFVLYFSRGEGKFHYVWKLRPKNVLA